MNAQQLKWHARQWSRYAGLLGLVGLGLLVFAALVYTKDVKPFERDLTEREIKLDRDLAELKRAAVQPPSPIEQADLNPPDSFTTFLRDSAQIAGKHRLSVLQSEYKTVTEADGALVRYGVQFPANGRYPDLRDFIGAMEAQPGVRVEALSASRLQVGDELLTVQLQLSYLTEVR
ncbi:hypothetical protein [Chitinolyticbacter meiyuanensis]|uniref:hypothetical protein n=1 Tax=Chitinolyticbacter meiyuanensis TaxID=682798 RepID=UPI0011E5D718|nr:hypothetical protein [Chitinolyticbacter meiyuanensis]